MATVIGFFKHGKTEFLEMSRSHPLGVLQALYMRNLIHEYKGIVSPIGNSMTQKLGLVIEDSDEVGIPEPEGADLKLAIELDIRKAAFRTPHLDQGYYMKIIKGHIEHYLAMGNVHAELPSTNPNVELSYDVPWANYIHIRTLDRDTRYEPKFQAICDLARVALQLPECGQSELVQIMEGKVPKIK